MQRAHDVARKYLGRNAVWMKDSYDVKCSMTRYNVCYVTESCQLDEAPKLRVNFQVPYLVLDRLENLGYWVQPDARGKQRLVHMIS